LVLSLISIDGIEGQSPELLAGLRAGALISIEGIEGLESFYEETPLPRGEARSVSEPSRIILVGAVFLLEESCGEALR
jgi:hypothetical protein